MSSHWSFFPSANKNGINIKYDQEAIKDQLLHYLLLQTGEHPMFPTIGIPNYLFRTIDQIDPEAFAEIIRQNLEQINIRLKLGIQQINVVAVENSEDLSTFELDIYLKFDQTTPIYTLQLDYDTISRYRNNYGK